MQSHAISEMIQVSAQFCASAPSHRDGENRFAAPAAVFAPRKQAQQGRRSAVRSAKITFFSDTCLKTCGHRAQLGYVKLSLGSRKPEKRKRNVRAAAGRSPRKPRFARASLRPAEHDELVQSRA